ncbi:hypothetical protein J4E91_009938 [Alternaria rosae]|nr:hypothetical protein J4E91_009938 [Alternaria rosae]
MLNSKPVEPETRDHYLDLGLDDWATTAETKKAFKRLALLYHPDKKVPGQAIDTIEFRRVNWDMYRSDYADYEDRVERERVEAEEKRMRVQKEQQRQAEEERHKAKEKARAEAERTIRKKKEKPAELRSRQAAARAEAAEERLQKWKEEQEAIRKQRREQRQQEAEAREAIVREQHRLEQERKAQEYLAALEAQQKLAEQKVRQEEELMVRKYMQQFFSETPDAENQRIQRRVRLAHIWARQLRTDAKTAAGAVPDAKSEYVELGWHKINGTAICDFCVKDVRLYFFACPLGGAAACGDCKYKFAHGYETASGEVIGNRKGEEKKAGKVGGRKGKAKGKGKGKI